MTTTTLLLSGPKTGPLAEPDKDCTLTTALIAQDVPNADLMGMGCETVVLAYF